MKKSGLFTVFLFFYFSGNLLSQSWTQGFENVDSLFTAGWVRQNNSEPVGFGEWRKDNGNFIAQNGTPKSSIICDFSSVGGNGVGNISNWLFTPLQLFENGDTLFFWTRSYANLYYPDRLEVRISSNGTSTDAGTDQFAVGVFTDLLLSINPNMDTSLANGYPLSWKRFAVPIPSLYHGQSGRVAFRYFVTNGGANGTNGSTIAIDNMQYKWVGEVIGLDNQPQIWWQVFPNPTSGIATVTVDQPVTYRLLTLGGKPVGSGRFEEGMNLLNLSGLSYGTYLIEISLSSSGQSLFRKIQVY